jgi:deazaflavin-dependent oxidoreductase (nitroreductase family)
MVMMLALVLGLVLAGVAAFGSVLVLGMRTKWPPVLDRVRRRNRVVLNPEQMKTAGQPGAFAGVLRHTGRISGTAYETPLGTVPIDDGFVIALVYGPRTEWLNNVLASGTTTIVYEGTTYEVDHPEVVPVEEVADAFTRQDQLYHRIFAVESCLLLHRVDRAVD